MPIQINGTTIIDETLLADKNLSNLSEDGKNVIKSLASGVGGMKRPDYANGSEQNIACSCRISSGGVTNISYTSITIPSNGYILLYNILEKYPNTQTHCALISNAIVNINNKFITLDALYKNLIPVTLNDIISFTNTFSISGVPSTQNYTFNICQFMFYPELQ